MVVTCIVKCILSKETEFTSCTCAIWFITNVVFITYFSIFRYWCGTVRYGTIVILVFSILVRDVAPFEVMTVGSRCGLVFCSWCGKCCWSIFTFSYWCCIGWCGGCSVGGCVRCIRCGSNWWF